MANPEHVELVKQGAAAIAQWLRANPDSRLDLAEADLSRANLRWVELNGANLSGADLTGADLSHADFSYADLLGADLSKADLRRADLTGAKLNAANFHRADLFEADLSDVNLSGADLTRAYLFRTIFRETNLTNASLGEAGLYETIFADVDLRQVKDLETIRHHGPSQISVGTLYKSQGQIPEVFLRGCGVPDNLITFLHSLTGQAFEYYSCFISYTEADDAFSKRLYNDLQGAGIRCWRWREDAKIGSGMTGEVVGAIRMYDKLVVILSEHSLAAEPVIREIDLALLKEARDKKEVLFPIRMDDAIFSWTHPLKDVVLLKVIGDFRQWQNPAAYAATLQQVIKCLKAPSAKTP